MSNPDTTPRSPIELTVFSKSGGPLTKRIRSTADGKIASDGNACYMARGRAKRVRIGGIGELAVLIERLNSSQAIALGALRDGLPDEINILTKARDQPRAAAIVPSRERLRTSSIGPDSRAGAVRFRHQGNAAAVRCASPPVASGRRWCRCSPRSRRPAI